jgi:hypothetical protein
LFIGWEFGLKGDSSITYHQPSFPLVFPPLNGAGKGKRTAFLNDPNGSEIFHSETDPYSLQTDLVYDGKLIFFEFLIGIGSNSACGDV